MDNNICSTCTYRLGYKCNRLVIAGGFGCNDRLGSDYKHGNECPYYKEGKGRDDEHIGDGNVNFWNS